jgi:hypothetical protein
LRKTYEALKPDGKFIIYQVTNELRQHAIAFQRDESEYFLQNIPPMFITVFHKTPSAQGVGRISTKSKSRSRLAGVGAERSA